MSNFDTAVDQLLIWQEHPCAFVSDEFHVEPDRFQVEALEAFASRDPAKQRISMQACAGPGKSAVLAWCGLNFLSCYGEKGEHPKGACVSVTGENLNDNLWAEYAKWLARSEYLSRKFRWTQDRIYAIDHPETWFISARAWPKSADAETQGKTLAGLHSKFVLAQIDESGAVPITVLKAAEQALSNCWFGKIMQAGNPISLEGMLYAASSMYRHLWHVIRVTGDPDDPKAWVHAPRLGDKPKAWAAEQIATYGRDDPWVKSYILGKFPDQSFNALLGPDEVEAAMVRHLRTDAYSWAQKRLGVDVARFGGDRNVIFPRQGLASFRPIVMRNKLTTDIAARVAEALVSWEAEEVYVDDTGHWGHGVIDNLTAGHYPATPVIFSDPANDKRYKNRRAEMWISMAKWVKAGGALPHIPELLGELITPTYTFVNGVFQLEDKDQVKARLGRSPDLADALALTFAMPDMPGHLADDVDSARRRGGASRGHAATDFDPYEPPVTVDESPRARIAFDPFVEGSRW